MVSTLSCAAVQAPYSDPDQLQRQMVTMATAAEHTVQRVEMLTKEVSTIPGGRQGGGWQGPAEGGVCVCVTTPPAEMKVADSKHVPQVLLINTTASF